MLAFLLTVAYKSDEKIIIKNEALHNFSETKDVKILKDFLLSKIKSPFLNI